MQDAIDSPLNFKKTLAELVGIDYFTGEKRVN